MNAVDILKYGHVTLMKTVEGLEDPQWATSGVCGVWSCQEIMAHLASYEWMLVEVLQGLLGTAEATPLLELMGTQGSEAFNKAEVGKRRTKSAAEILQDYQAGQTQTMQLIARISPEKCRENGTLP